MSDPKIHLLGSPRIDANTLVAKAQEHLDDMDGAMLVWYTEGTNRREINFLTSGMSVPEANLFLDQIKHLIQQGVFDER